VDVDIDDAGELSVGEGDGREEQGGSHGE
jgi:hypothetical protein